jgi:hypothetical protein
MGEEGMANESKGRGELAHGLLSGPGGGQAW